MQSHCRVCYAISHLFRVHKATPLSNERGMHSPIWYAQGSHLEHNKPLGNSQILFACRPRAIPVHGTNDLSISGSEFVCGPPERRTPTLDNGPSAPY